VGRNYLHREMGLYRLLRHLQGTEDLTHFLQRTLGALEAYDREHNAELVDSLVVLLEQGGNVSAAAKVMHLHRNSLIYRVERIRDIAGLDPTNAEDGFTLRLALMLAPLR
jgi:purine catabolism regulator